MPETGDGVPLLRIVPEDPQQLDAKSQLPTGNAFRPSPADARGAEEGERAIRLTVWDLDRTTKEQALDRLPKDKPRYPFTLKSDDVREVAARFNRPELVVVRDEIAGPGGSGHCGIEGLGPRQKSSNQDKAIRTELANRCVPA